MDLTTAGLARMNMILHDFPAANILLGNTLSDPKFKDAEKLRTYDLVVANPPFRSRPGAPASRLPTQELLTGRTRLLRRLLGTNHPS